MFLKNAELIFSIFFYHFRYWILFQLFYFIINLPILINIILLHLSFCLKKYRRVKISYALIIICLLTIGYVHGQTDRQIRKIQVPPTVCYASEKVERVYIPPPAEILLKSAKKSDIIVTYSLFPADAKVAFEYAISIWEHIIESDIPIYMDANWRTIYDSKGNINTILGQSGPTDYYADFKYAPHLNRYYPVALAEKITNSVISGPASPDIDATFNKEIKWYFGTDGNTPDQLYDFVSVVLHEIGHGLGFTGFFFATGNSGGYARDGGEVGEASAFDFMVVDGKNEFLTDTNIYQIPSVKLYNAFVSDNLSMISPAAMTGNNGKKPKLYAPSTWSDGSSIYHLDDATYPASSGNSLMTHAIGKGEAIHDPGPITTGILADIGWKIMKLDLEKPKDTEVKNPIVFNLKIESDYKLDSNKVFVYYSKDSFTNDKDSLLFRLDGTTGKFSAVLYPDIESGKFSYYISARDIMNRTFYVPSEAPGDIYSVTIGIDNQLPEIVHTPVPYYLLSGEKVKLSTFADDNLGVDTVFVEYSVNNVPHQPFGLRLDSANIYSGYFNIDPQLLNDQDKITYKITAIDSSAAKNVLVSPADSFYSFRIEKIFNPATGYYCDFNVFNRDFIIADFDIYTPSGFENGSLNSPHPYPSPNKNNSEFNFTTILKYPIILNEKSIMSYDEIVLVEPGETLSKFGDDNFWDYVIVEGSKDTGKTWLPLAPGYDSGDNTTWKTNYNKNIDSNSESTAVAIPDWYVNRQINLLGNGSFNAGDTILIRFRLYSDPYAHGWGWTIDNLRIQTPVSAPMLTLSPGNVLIYPNPFSNKINISVQAKANIRELSLDIVDVYGQTVKTFINNNVIGEIKFELELGYLACGIYFVVVKENGTPVSTQKIIRY